LLIAVMSFLTVVAQCPSLHEKMHCHHDGDKDGACDTCVVCMMAQGHMDCPAPAPIQDSFVSILIPSPPPAINSTPILRADLRLAPGRAPPLC
jgi:hypothetical protein